MDVNLKNVRLSFPSLFETAKYQGNDLGKYEATFLIKKDSAVAAKIQAAIKKAGSDELGKDWSKAKLCLMDGDEKDYDGYEGCWALKASTKKRPVLVHRDKSPLTESDGVLYPGCYVNANVDIYAFANNYGKFVMAQLNGIQYSSPGEEFGGGGSRFSADDFDDISENDDDDDDDGAPF
jgi:hypothetical protein